MRDAKFCELNQILHNLQHGGPNSRLKSLSSLASNVAPNIDVGGHAVAEIILSFCDDGDARVRACALNCLCNWIKQESSSDELQRRFRLEWITENWVRVYIAACRLITEDDSMVREVSIWTIYYLGLRFPKHETPVDAITFSGGLLEHASLDLQSCPPTVHKFKHSRRKRSVCLVEDAFSRVCDRLQDPSRGVRQLAASLIADLAEFVTEETLMLTLEKTVMSDRQVKRSAVDRSGQDKTGLWGPVTTPGRRSNLSKASNLAPSAGNAPLSVDSIPLLSTGCTGALINGLEDEFHEVRCATLATLRQITAYSARFASVCQDLLVDMLTDDIQAVRLQAVHALQAVGDQVPILNDQIAIVTSTLAEDSVLMRRRLHQLLSRCRLVSPPCLLSLLDGLLSNLRRYPDDRDSIWKCAASVGSRHPAFVEVCVSSLLRTHPWLSDQEPFREDPAYITVLLLVLNALPGAPGMKAHFPRHLAASKAYLAELVPHLLTNIDVDFSFVVKPSTNLCIPAKRPCLEERRVTPSLERTQGLLNFLASSLLMVRNLLDECVHLLLGSHSSGALVKTESPSNLDVIGHAQQEFTAGCRAWRLRDSLCHLCRLIDQELRTCQQQRDRHLGDLPAWLDCLASAGYGFLLAVSCCNDATRPSIVLIKDPERQRVKRFLRRALRLSLKAEFLFIGLSKLEVQSVQRFRGHLLRSLDSSAAVPPTDVRKEACAAVSCLTDLFDSLLESLRSDRRQSSAEPLPPASLGRIRGVSAQLLFPPVYGADKTESTDSVGGAGAGTGGVSAASAHSGGTPSLPSTPVSLPEVRFTAILATAAVRIHAVFAGFSLEEARERIRVLYRRPDYLQHSGYQDEDTERHFHQKCPLLTWHPPPNAWKPLETLLSTESSAPDSSLSQLELQTTLELTAPSWTDAATLELGLGLCVPMLSSADSGNDSGLKRRDGGETVLPLLPHGAMAKIKLFPCGPSQRW